MNRRHRLSGRRRITMIRTIGAALRVGAARIRAVEGRAESARAAIAVVRAGSSVERNRARRRARAALAAALAGRPPVDMVVWVRADAASMPFADLSRSMAGAVDAAVATVGRR